MQDTRNVVDDFKGMTEAEISSQLDQDDHGLVIALENIDRDFSMGSIVRSANAFGVRHVYVIGRKQWNKRGAMMTDKYLHMHYMATLDEFTKEMSRQDREIVAVDNVAGSVPMQGAELSKNIVLVFGQEGPGISDELRQMASKIVAIEQFGSTRSINVGSAAAIAMYCWLQRHVLQ